MTIFEFLQELATFFPLEEQDDVMKKRIAHYTQILEAETVKTKLNYNFPKLIQWFLTNYKYKSFPNMATILEALPNAAYHPQTFNRCINEEELLVVTLSSGQMYEFTVSGVGKSIDLLKANIKQKFGDCTYKFYPKGTQIIGNQIIMP